MSKTVTAPDVALLQRREIILRCAKRWRPRAWPGFTLDPSCEYLEDVASERAWRVRIGAQHVFFQAVSWTDRDTAIEPVAEIPIPAAEVTPTEDPVRSDMRQAHDLLAAYQRGESLRRRLRGVAEDDDVEVMRLAGQCPSGAVNAAGEPLGWRTSCRRLAVESAEASGMLVALVETHRAVADFLVAAEPRLRAALVAATAPTPHGLDAVRPLGMLGADSITVPRSAREENLDALDDLFGRLRRASVEVTAALPILDTLTRRLARATVRAVHEVERREIAVVLARLDAERAALQRPSPAAELAAEAIRRLG